MFRLFVAIFGIVLFLHGHIDAAILHFPKTATALIQTMAVNHNCVCLDKVYSFIILIVNDAPFDELRRVGNGHGAGCTTSGFPGLHILV
jgi:hypothetical protein